MDIKIHGMTRPIVEEAIARTRQARLYIMDEVMSKAIAQPRQEVAPLAPKIIQIQIDPMKIGDVVGQRGKTINEIIDRTGVKIDINDEGSVSICGTDKEMMEKAVEMIEIITTNFEEGQIFKGKVVSIKEFGAFVEFAPGKRRHGAYFQDYKRKNQPCGRCTDAWRHRYRCLPWQRQDGARQL